MRFLVDNSLSPKLAEGLRLAGHSAVHVRELGISGADDDTIFEAAAHDDQMILAADTDFATILANRRAAKPSVVLFRCRKKSASVLLPMLLRNLEQVRADLEAGAVVVFDDARLRIRRLPIGVEA